MGYLPKLTTTIFGLLDSWFNILSEVWVLYFDFGFHGGEGFPHFHRKEAADIGSSASVFEQNYRDYRVSFIHELFAICRVAYLHEPRVMGTSGYVVPEYANIGILNQKSGVYSFGVLLLEATTGQNHVHYVRPSEEVCFRFTIWVFSVAVWGVTHMLRVIWLKELQLARNGMEQLQATCYYRLVISLQPLRWMIDTSMKVNWHLENTLADLGHHSAIDPCKYIVIKRLAGFVNKDNGLQAMKIASGKHHWVLSSSGQGHIKIKRDKPGLLMGFFPRRSGKKEWGLFPKGEGSRKAYYPLGCYCMNRITNC
ncbi:putative receptor-like protein kinase [Artemisia annua]|uniref:non-specific serine/threonine protein kinase n=1 Tax=Artemisia annua TaxID=35608 RepID=A0A2U1PSJ9_ARTAN|nr:putative receptor-like protein kinase [Artemisia annua]